MTNLTCHYRPQMKFLTKSISAVLAGLLSVGTPLMAGEPVQINTVEEVRAFDVVLHSGGVVHGTVLNTEGQPVSGVAVNILHHEATVATTVSNEDGKFAMKGLRNGAHIIEVGAKQQAVRLWGSNTAPPAAIENVAIVVNEEAVRGQMLGGTGGLLRSNIGGIVLIGAATAITLGTTLDNNAASASP